MKRFACFFRRWVDDLFLIFATRYPLSNIQCAGIRLRFTEAYEPFGLKNEDASSFVGLQTEVIGPTLRFGVLRKERPGPKYAHARSNITRSQIRGLMKTVVTRAIDSSTDAYTILTSVREIWEDFQAVGHNKTVFLSVLTEIRRKYPYLSDALPTSLK